MIRAGIARPLLRCAIKLVQLFCHTAPFLGLGVGKVCSCLSSPRAPSGTIPAPNPRSVASGAISARYVRWGGRAEDAYQPQLFGEMAGCPMFMADFSQRGRFGHADRLRIWAARVEIAATRRVGRIGNVAGQHDWLGAYQRVGLGHG